MHIFLKRKIDGNEGILSFMSHPLLFVYVHWSDLIIARKRNSFLKKKKNMVESIFGMKNCTNKNLYR